MTSKYIHKRSKQIIDQTLYVLTHLRLSLFATLILLHEHKWRSWHSNTADLYIMKTWLSWNSTRMICQRVIRRYPNLHDVENLAVSSSNSCTSRSYSTKILSHLLSCARLLDMYVLTSLWRCLALIALLCYSPQCRRWSHWISVLTGKQNVV